MIPEKVHFSSFVEELGHSKHLRMNAISMSIELVLFLSDHESPLLMFEEFFAKMQAFYNRDSH